MVPDVSFEEYFKYHQFDSPEIAEKFRKINEAALALAMAIDECVVDYDPKFKDAAILKVIKAKMLANQGVTVAAVRASMM